MNKLQVSRKSFFLGISQPQKKFLITLFSTRLNYPGLVRAADLIGQLSDPRYLQKTAALFYEFEQTGQNQVLGYRTPGDLRDGYPKFYWNVIYRYVKDAIGYLEVTQQGKQVVANLSANVFRVEHSEVGLEQVAVVR